MSTHMPNQLGTITRACPARPATLPNASASGVHGDTVMQGTERAAMGAYMHTWLAPSAGSAVAPATF